MKKIRSGAIVKEVLPSVISFMVTLYFCFSVKSELQENGTSVQCIFDFVLGSISGVGTVLSVMDMFKNIAGHSDCCHEN